MATSKIQVTEGSGKNIATHSIAEDAVTKEVQRIVSNTSSGVEIFNATTPGVVGGNVVAGATDSGNPLKAGAVYKATPVTRSDGQRTDLVADVNENLKTTLGTTISSTVDSISAKIATDALVNGNTELTPKFAPIAVSGSGNNTIVAAVTGKKIRVIKFKISASAAVNWKWQSGASGTDITGLTYGAINTIDNGEFCPTGHFETTSATLLNLNLSGAIPVGGYVVYVEV